MYQNPYMANFQPQFQQFQQPALPQQQILTANGKTSIDALKMSPNSSCLIADTTAPIIWKCVSDGLGNVSAEAYDISIHVDKPPVDLNSLETRVASIEQLIASMRGNNDGKPNPKQSNDKRNQGTNQ